MAKPFKVHDPVKRNTNQVTPIAAPLPGKAIIHSQKTGEYLPDGSKDSMHEPCIPWPEPVLGVDHMPFKLKPTP